MKKIIILSTLFICSLSAHANEQFRKDKKALCDLIKKEYPTWIVTQNEGYSDIEALETSVSPIQSPRTIQSTDDKKPVKKNTTYKKYSKQEVFQFSDFEFTIVHHQAVVKFTVNQQVVSAFLEKDNGEWKLVCAAYIDQSV